MNNKEKMELWNKIEAVKDEEKRYELRFRFYKMYGGIAPVVKSK